MFRRAWIEPAAVLSVFILLILSQSWFWLGGGSSVHDTFRNFPIWAYFADCLQRGFFPLWDPYLETGQPFYLVSPGMIQAWHPWSLLLIFAGKIARVPLLDLYHYDWLIRFFVFALGSYFLLRHLIQSRLAAFLAFVSLVFSSLGVSYLWQSSYLISVWSAPWLLLSLIRFFESGSAAWLIPLALAAGLAAQSYHVIYPAIFLLLWIACFFILERPTLRFNRKQAWLAAPALILFLLLIFKIGAEIMAWGSVMPVLRGEVNRGSFASWPDFYLALTPYLEHAFVSNVAHPLKTEARMYLGLAPLLMAVLGALFARRSYKNSFLAAGILSALLALGKFGPLAFICARLPIIRNMADFHVFFLLCTAVLAGFGIEWFLEEKKSWRRSLPVLAVFLIVGFAALFAALKPGLLFVHSLDSAGRIQNCFSKSALHWSLFAASCALLWSFLRRRAIFPAKILLCAAILADGFIYSSVYIRVHAAPRKEIPAPLLQSSLPPFRFPESRIEHAFDPHFFNAAAVARIASAYHQNYHFGSHYIEKKDFHEFMALDNREAMDSAAGISRPLLRVLGNFEVGSREEIREKMRRSPKSLINTVFVEEDLGISPKPVENLGSAQILSYGPNRCDIEAECREDCVLYYSDGYDPAWKASVDGKKAKIYRANLAFKALPLKAGLHRISFVYDPFLFKLGLILYAAGILLGCATLFLAFFRLKV